MLRMEGKKSSVKTCNTFVNSDTYHGCCPCIWQKINQSFKEFLHKPKLLTRMKNLTRMVKF